MSGTTAISWTDATLNPLPHRCTAISPGCDNCYARVLTDRWEGKGAFESEPPAYVKLGLLLLPWTDARFREAYRIFLVSMSDPFHSALPIQDLALMWAMMAADQRHLYQVLTKRQGPMASRLSWPDFPAMVQEELAGRLSELACRGRRLTPTRRQILSDIEAAQDVAWPLPNVMLGVSAEDRHWWKIRVPVLRGVPAAGRFVSVEPYLHELGPVDLTGIHWVICGGESGNGYRPMDLDWARDLRDQCREQDVAFWFKQSSARRPGTGELLDGREWKQHYEGMAIGRD